MRELIDEAKKKLPLKLQNANRWVIWVREEGGFKFYQPSEHEILPTYPRDPYTWDSIDEALRALFYNKHFYEQYKAGAGGIAWVNSATTPVYVITFYRAFRDGKLAPWVLPAFDILQAYAEEGARPGTLIFLWEETQEFSFPNVVVSRPAFVPLTLKKVPGSPNRVGTAKSQIQRLVAWLESNQQKQKQRTEQSFADKGPYVSKVLRSLVPYGLRSVGEDRWLSRCPNCQTQKPTLWVSLRKGKLRLKCSKGCSPLKVIEALKLEPSNEILLKEPEAPSVPKDALLPEEERSFVEEAYYRFFHAENGEEILSKLGIDQEDAIEGYIGVTEQDEVVVPVVYEGSQEDISVNGYYLLSNSGRVIKSVPETPMPWTSPKWTEAERLIVVPDIAYALALWGTLNRRKEESWGVVYLPDEIFPVSLFRRIPPRKIYLWTGGSVETFSNWKAGFKALPHQIYVISTNADPRTLKSKELKELLNSAEKVEL